MSCVRLAWQTIETERYNGSSYSAVTIEIILLWLSVCSDRLDSYQVCFARIHDFELYIMMEKV